MILGAENGQNLVDRSETLSAVRSLIEQALLYHDFGESEVYAIKICGIRSALDNSLFDAMLLGTADESQTAPTSRKGAWTCNALAKRVQRSDIGNHSYEYDTCQRSGKFSLGNLANIKQNSFRRTIFKRSLA